MVRVHAVRIVTADHKARGNRAQILLLRPPAAHVHAPQNVLQERRGRALLRAASDLLIVKHAVDLDAFLRLCIKKAHERSVRALQIVKSPAGNELPVRAEDGSLHPVIEKQVRIEDILLTHAELIRDEPQEITVRSRLRKERLEIDLRIKCIAAVDVPVHVNRKRRNHEKIAVDINEP